MKRILLITLAFLLIHVSADAATITSAGTGPWSTGGTWVGGVAPGIGDTAIIANGHTVTLTASTTVGTSPADQTTMVVTTNASGKLIINTDVVLTIRGNMLVDAADVVGLEMNPGSKIVMDASVSSQAYTFKGGDDAIIYARGTSGNPAYIESLSGYTYGIVTPYLANKGPYFDSDYLYFRRLGTSSVTGFTAFANSASYYNYLTIKHAVWDTCGSVYAGAKAGDSVVLIEDSKIINPTNTTTVAQFYGFTATTGSFTFQRNVITGGNTSFYPATGIDAIGNYFEKNASSGLYTGGGDRGFKSFTNNVVRIDANPLAFVGDVNGSYWFRDDTTTNTKAFANYRLDVNRTLQNSVFDFPTSTDPGVGDIIMPEVVNAGATATISRNLFLPNSLGGSSGKPVSMFFAGVPTAINGNTYVSTAGGEQGVGVGEGGAGDVGQVTSFRNNLVWTPSTKTSGYKFQRQQSAVQDYVSAANADYNWGWNLADGSEGNGYEALLGYRTTAVFSTGTPDVNGGSGDPQFVDTTRNFATYDIAGLGNSAGTAWATATSYIVGDVLSTASTNFYGNTTINYRCITAHTSSSGDATNGQPGVATNWRTNWEYQTAYRLREDVTRVPTFITWVRNGFAPQNASLDGTGYGSVDIGAVDVLTAGAAPIGIRLLMGY